MLQIMQGNMTMPNPYLEMISLYLMYLLTRSACSSC